MITKKKKKKKRRRRKEEEEQEGKRKKARGAKKTKKTTNFIPSFYFFHHFSFFLSLGPAMLSGTGGMQGATHACWTCNTSSSLTLPSYRQQRGLDRSHRASHAAPISSVRKFFDGTGSLASSSYFYKLHFRAVFCGTVQLYNNTIFSVVKHNLQWHKNANT
jgi:hypothetical protein